MKTVMDKIKEFESGEETVARFNKLFNQKLDHSSELIVTVGEILGPDTVRMLPIDGMEFKHDFTRTLGEMLYE
jgi:hypothetical protein